ncbi:uncharacterized mitochondrial protein-like protein [Tanacetum coccineum]
MANGLVLISKKLIGSENYSLWKRSMMIALNARNKLELVNSEFGELALNSEIRSVWERANDMVISWVLNIISEQIGNNLSFINSASALWNELDVPTNPPVFIIRRTEFYQVTNDIINHKQNNTIIELYYHKLKGLWDELDALEATYACLCRCACVSGRKNGEREQRKRLIQFLMGLDESYINVREPQSFTQASKDVKWIEAMNKEIQALEQNKTWTLTTLPQGKIPIGSKWVYKIKLQADGNIERYKARLVAQGFNQKEGIDYKETFAPVAKMVTVRTLIAVAIKEDCIKDLGQLSYYLGIEFLRNKTGIAMTQRKYALELLEHASLLSIPLDPIIKLNSTDREPLSDPSQYRTLVGKLLYLTITRPDLAFAAQALSQFSHDPRTPHYKALIKVLRYIKLCPGQGLFFPTQNSLHLTTYNLPFGSLRVTLALHYRLSLAHVPLQFELKYL